MKPCVALVPVLLLLAGAAPDRPHPLDAKEEAKGKKASESSVAPTTQLEAADAARIKTLVEQLGDKDFRQREKAEAGLVAIGASALDALQLASKDADSERALRAKKVIRRLECLAAGEARWSATVNGLQARLSLERRQSADGAPFIAPYITLRNVSDVATPMTIPWDGHKITYTVTDRDGNEIQPSGGGSGPAFWSYQLVLPKGGSLTFDITRTRPVAREDKAIQLDFDPGMMWVMNPDGEDRYLQAVLDIPNPHAADRRIWYGRIEIPLVRIPLRPFRAE